MKFKIYDKKGEFLGLIHGANEEDAIREAKLFDMPDALIAIPVILPNSRVIHFLKRKLNPRNLH